MRKLNLVFMAVAMVLLFAGTCFADLNDGLVAVAGRSL